MGKHNEVFVGLEVANVRHAAAVAEEGQQGEIRYIGKSAPAPRAPGVLSPNWRCTTAGTTFAMGASGDN